MDYRGSGDITQGPKVINQQAVKRQWKRCGWAVEAKNNKLYQENTANCK